MSETHDYTHRCPKFSGAAEEWEPFVSLFRRWLRVSNIPATSAVDHLVLSGGTTVVKLYDEQSWPESTGSDLDAVLSFLNAKFIAPKNVLTERIAYYAVRQNSGSISSFVSTLRNAVKSCKFGAFEDEMLRDIFCVGLDNDDIRRAVCRAFAQSDAEMKPFTFSDAIRAAEVEQAAMQQASQSDGATPAIVSSSSVPVRQHGLPKSECRRCGYPVHKGASCPAQHRTCNKCGKTGHFASVCRTGTRTAVVVPSEPNADGKRVIDDETACCNTVFGRKLRKYVKGENPPIKWLIDTGSDITIISSETVSRHNLSASPINMEVRDFSGGRAYITGKVTMDVHLLGAVIGALTVYVADCLCEDGLLGASALGQFRKVELDYGGPLSPIKIAATSLQTVEDLTVSFSDVFDHLGTLRVCPPKIIYGNKLSRAAPIRTRSRRVSRDDEAFMDNEIAKLLRAGKIERSQSEWRSQAFVVRCSDEARKPRMVIDYKSTINQFTDHDAEPLSTMDEVIEQVSKWQFFSRIDLRGAYHQLPLRKEERHFTAFEAGGSLYQFKVLPFGVTNGPAGFSRAMKAVLAGLEGVARYADDIIVGGVSREEHHDRLRMFLQRAREKGLVLNSEKCKFGVAKLQALGHIFESGKLRPDPDRMSPLLNFPIPTDARALRRFIGLATFYRKWIKGSAEILGPLFDAMRDNVFPLTAQAIASIRQIKTLISSAELAIPRPGSPLTLETDASLSAIGGVLSQNGAPVAFVSHRLNNVERRWAAVELEAYAIYRCINTLRPFLIGQQFEVITDQQAVSHLFGAKPRSTVRNAKLLRWRVELAEYCYTIRYRPGDQNTVADALSRCAAASDRRFDHVTAYHRQLGHPGCRRTLDAMKRDGVTWSGIYKDVKAVVSECETCARLKPQFGKDVPQGSVIRSRAAWERLSVDFKGPLPETAEGYRYLLTVIDEFSRFVFGFPLREATAQAAVEKLDSIFTLCGPPNSLHSDQGSQFESRTFQDFLARWGVRKSRTSPYNPAGNGQCERANGIIWKTVQLRIQDEKRAQEDWARVLPQALANVRSLTTRGSGTTPHARFFRFERKSLLKPTPPAYAQAREGEENDDIPAWLREGRMCIYKRANRVEDVVVLKLLSAQHARVQTKEGSRVVVSTRHLSRLPCTIIRAGHGQRRHSRPRERQLDGGALSSSDESVVPGQRPNDSTDTDHLSRDDDSLDDTGDSETADSDVDSDGELERRTRSGRIVRRPARFRDA